MTSRIIRTGADIDALTDLLRARSLPVTVSIAKGVNRSTEQNRLQRKWLGEIAEQLGDQTTEEVRGYCKLTMGVPIMREANEVFCEKYDRIVKPHSYEEKLEMMMEPLDFPVTRLMTTRQKTQFLDHMQQHFAAQGVRLTDPKGACDG